MNSLRPLVAALAACVVVWLVSAGGAGGPTPRGEAALEALGLRLLAERRLAAGGDRSCLSCHRPELGYTDGLAVAAPGGLNTPTLWGLGGRGAFGWRSPEVRSLEAMALRPLADPAEMGPLAEATLERLRADGALVAAYRSAFPEARELVTWEQTALALAAAVRAIQAPASPYDRHLAGEAGALAPEALQGQALFAELGCAACHRPPAFATDSYHSVGVAAGPDGGRVRVPGLRGVARTAPYFHDGSAATLEEVVRHYARGGGPGASPALTPLLLTEGEVRDLVAFLEGL
ncbi:MAG TPA: cytochrome c peroxidase [Chloroflexaceae bacterium]|nr:cytochrome c peroxidase [Chloroflexaceae bacterium]